MSANEVMTQRQPLPSNHPKEIAALFSQLQVSVDQAQHKTRFYDSKAAPSPSNLPPTPLAERRSSSSISTTTTNSPISPHHSSLMTCPCHHLLVSMDSEHCATCDSPIEVMISLQDDRSKRVKRLKAFRRQLLDITTTQDQQQNDMMALQRTILEHREALMAHDDDMVSLQHDMALLQTKYDDECAQIGAIETSKQAAKLEIEELGRQLFKEAHDMVATEQEEKAVLKSSCDDLRLRLDQSQTDLAQVGQQLRALRKNMGRWGDHQDEQHKIPSNNHTTAISPTATGLNDATDSQRSSMSAPHPASPPSLLSIATNDTTTASVIPATSQNFFVRAKMDLAALQEGEHIFMNDDLQLETFEDDQQLLDFQDFMDSATSTSFSLKKLHGLPFIKICLSDDIEPCLRFKMVNSKRILEAIQIKTCFVEKCPPGFIRELAGLLRKDRLAKKNKPSLWDKFGLSLDDSLATTTPATAAVLSSSSSTTTTATTASSDSSSSTLVGHYISCATCGRRVMDNEEDPSVMERELAYRFRISYFDEWACIDRYCADRLNSVIAFYGFLRKLRLGTYNGRSLMEVYQECSRLRLLMFLSR